MRRAEDQGTSYLRFLDDLLEEEVAQKEQRRIKTTLKISGLPFIKSIDEFDFTFQPKLDRLLHHSTVINIRGNSYRLKGKNSNEAWEADQNTGKSGSVLTTENGSVLKDR